MNPEENYQQPELQQSAPESLPTTTSSVRNPLEAMRPGEQVVCEIKRHPIGIYSTYAIATFMFIVALVAAIAVPMLIKTSSSSLNTIVWGICGIVMLVAFVMLYIGNKVYWGNRWIVTSDSITQTLQTSLFDIQSSQLSMGNIEDVTVEQDGMLCHMFGYGLLRVETAGEHSKFVFPYCPVPNEYAKKILAAREQFEQGRRGEDEQRLYREQGAYAQQQPYQQEPPPPASPVMPPPPSIPPSSGGNMPGQV